MKRFFTNLYKYNMSNLLFVALGSMFGGVSRYWLSGFIQKNFDTAFPVGVFIVNIAGCFLMGIIAGLLAHANVLTNNHRLLLAVGFCGSFTTFSTFSLDNLQLLSAKADFLLSLNIVLSVILVLAATWCGYYLVLSLSK